MLIAIHFANELHLYIQTSMSFICEIIESQYTSARLSPRRGGAR